MWDLHPWKGQQQMFDVCNSNCYSHSSTWCDHAWPDNVLLVLQCCRCQIKQQRMSKTRDRRKESAAHQQLCCLCSYWGLLSQSFCPEAAAEQEEHSRDSCPWRGLQPCPWHQALPQWEQEPHSHIPDIPMAMETSPFAVTECPAT